MIELYTACALALLVWFIWYLREDWEHMGISDWAMIVLMSATFPLTFLAYVINMTIELFFGDKNND